WLEGAGTRGTLELVAETVLLQIRAGTPPHEIAVVCPSVDAVRLALGTAFAAVGVPVSFEGRAGLGTTPYGHALLSLLRFAWVGGERPKLFAHLRSPYSGLGRKEVDWIEGRLRGRGIVRGDRAAEVAAEHGRPCPARPAGARRGDEDAGRARAARRGGHRCRPRGRSLRTRPRRS